MPAHEFRDNPLDHNPGNPHHRGRHRLTWVRMMRQMRWLHFNDERGRGTPAQWRRGVAG